MAVGFSSYYIARSGLTVSERGLYVTGHNLANVNTTGYVRQQLMIKDSAYLTEFGSNGRLLQYGMGADVQETRQIRHTFLDNIYRNETKMLGYWETRRKTFQDVEAILNDPMGDGLQKVMNQFWDSWHELSKEPDSLTIRALVRQRSQAMVYHFNHIGEQLEKLQDDLNLEIQVRVGELNNITGDIAKLNKMIASNEINGDSANDFRDQRNLLLDRLSKLCDAEITEMQDGQVDVTLDGYFLVAKGISRNLYVESNNMNGSYYFPMLEGLNVQVQIKSGILKGLLESRGEVPGIKGVYENGNPKEKVDIAFAIDVSNGSEEYLTELKEKIAEYVADLNKSGVDYNIRFIKMGSTSEVQGGTFYTKDTIDSFLEDSSLNGFFNMGGETDGNFDGLISELEALQSSDSFRADAAKVAYVFTNKSINGDNGVPVTETDAAGYIDRLNALGMRTSVITRKSLYNEGEAGEEGWGAISAGTGGSLLNIEQDAEGYSKLLTEMNGDTRKAVNAAGNIPVSNNILSDLKIRLNAMVNAIAREINYIQMSGITLDGKPGVALFEPIDDSFPMQMGNIRLSDALLSDKGLNNISTSVTGAKGDNTLARVIANLRSSDIMTDSTGVVTIDEFYGSIILDMGNGGKEAVNISENQMRMVQSADNQRTAISGTSMDEEMANMMKFKFAYDASARVLNIIDSMVENVISSMGRVGR